MNGGQVMVVLIVLIAVIGGIVKNRHRAERRGSGANAAPDAESVRLHEEVRTLRERIQVLERVITDTHARNDLDQQIEQLRDRR